MPQQHDATLISLAELDDPEKYTTYRGIPVFKAHKKKGKNPDGSDYEINVTEEDLPEIAENMAALYDDHGVPARIVDGHIDPDKKTPENKQPMLLGFNRNPRFGHFGKKQEPCVMVDQSIKNDKLHIVRDGGRPYRSAEYYPPTKTIRGVALMVRDPFLDLGIVNYVSDDRPYFYSMENDMPSTMTPEKTKEMDVDESFSPEEEVEYAKFAKCMKRYAMGATGPSSPSGANTMMPAEVMSPEDEAKKKAEEAANAEMDMSASKESPILYSQLQQERKKNEDYRKMTADLIREREREKCEKMLAPLVQLYSMDHARELASLQRMTVKEREEQIAYIKANYNELPGGDRIEVYNGPMDPTLYAMDGASQSKEEGDAAVKLASSKRIKYEDALLEVRKNGIPRNTNGHARVNGRR